MRKLIELNAAIAETWIDTGYSDPLNVMTAIRDRLEALPTVDAVPVVRCRECIFWDKDHISCEGLAKCLTGEGGIRYRNHSDFCSRGERSEGWDR